MYDFGPLAAQNDDRLLTYFHKTKQASAILNFRVPLSWFIFVARPGAGKTALLKWVESSPGGHVSLVVKPDQTRLFSDDAISNTGDIRVMITAELFTALVSELTERSLGSPEAQRAGKEFLAKGWLSVVGGFFKHKFSGLSILGCGFTLKPNERRDYLRELRRTKQADAARKVLGKFGQNVDVCLLVDDPELIVGQGLVDVTPENALRVGAFLSVLADLQSLGVRVLAFLKEHVLQNVRANYPDFRHFADRIEGLEWTEDDLLEMLVRRVTTRLKSRWDAVFAFDQETMRSEILPFLVNGPRDLLYLCNLAGKRDGKLTKPNLEKGIAVLSSDKWGELASHYGKQWQSIDLFGRAMGTALMAKYRKKPIPPGGIKEVFLTNYQDPDSEIHSLRKTVDWIDRAKWDSPPVDERLFLIGCLGYHYHGATIYPWAGRSVDHFRLADSHFVSPLFAD